MDSVSPANKEGDPQPSSSEMAAVLFVALLVLALGTLWVDPQRLWLLLIPASFLIASFGAGVLADRALGGLLPGLDSDPVLRLAVFVGVGIACLALLAVLSALAGVFWVAGVVTFPLLVFGLFETVRSDGWRSPPRSFRHAIGGLVMGVSWLVAWLWATIPPTFFDELAYHLVAPQRALATGGLQDTPWVFFAWMPHASDLLLAWGMVLGGGLGARAAVFALWVACTLGAWSLAAVIAWPASPLKTALLVSAALASSPTLWFLATLPFAETCLATAVVTAMAVVLAAQGERRPWLALGLILGLAATVKLSGGVWAGAVLAAAVMVGWSARDVSRAGGIVLASSAPWLVRAYVHTGNPIYPMGYGLFGGRLWSEESRAKVLGDLPYGINGLDMFAVLRLPVDLVQHPERFGSASDVGVLAVTACVLLLLMPMISRLFGIEVRTRRMADAAAVFVLVAGAAWVATSPTTRFFAPALVVGLGVLAGMTAQLGPAIQRVALIGVFVLGVWGTARFVAQHTAVFSSYEVALGREHGDDYLSRTLDHYKASQFVQATLPADARVLFIGETRPYYFAREAVAPSAYDRHPLARWVQEAPSPEALASRLADEGFTHVVLNVREFRRLHDRYGVLAFSGVDAEMNERRLKDLPGALKLLFASNGVYVFEIPHR